MKKNPAALLILFLIICSLFMPLSINYVGQSKILNFDKLGRYVYLSRLEPISTEIFVYYNKLNNGFEYKNELGLYEGVTNGIVAFGNFFKNTILGTILDYLNGFRGKSIEIKIVWLFLGILYEGLKNLLFSFLELVVILLILLFQGTGSYIYIVSYLLTVLFITGMAYVSKNS